MKFQTFIQELLNLKMVLDGGIKTANYIEKMDQQKFGIMDINLGIWIADIFGLQIGISLI